jgi:hypothetical protein
MGSTSDLPCAAFSEVRIAAVQHPRAYLAKIGCPRVLITARARKTDQKEDALGRKSDRPTHKRLSAFEKLQSERDEKGLEEDLERDVEEREERKQIRQEEREEREQIRQEEREERKREREKARGQEQSS